MIHQMRVKSIGIGLSKSLALVALTCVAFHATPAWATIDDALFTVHVSEEEAHLAGDEVPPMFGAVRMFHRNTPYIELLNNASSDAPIVEFRMTIGDEWFHFSDELFGDFVRLGSRADSNLQHVELESQVEQDGNELIVNILGDGLLPGNLVRFKIDINTDENAPFDAPAPDYRTVLFDMDGHEHYVQSPSQMSTDDNAQIWVKYAMGEMTRELGPYAFEDPAVGGVGAQYINGRSFAPYRAGGSIDPVGMFQAGPVPAVIPEPSTLIIAVAGLAGLCFLGASRSNLPKRSRTR